MSEKTVVHTSGEAQAFWMLGGLYEMLLLSDETNGATTVMQMTIPGGDGPAPAHASGIRDGLCHQRHCPLQHRGEIFEAAPGSLFHIPAGTVENFEPTSTVRVLITYTPGGIDEFFAEAGERAKRYEVPPGA